jgi:restriction system protein
VKDHPEVVHQARLFGGAAGDQDQVKVRVGLDGLDGFRVAGGSGVAKARHEGFRERPDGLPARSGRERIAEPGLVDFYERKSAYQYVVPQELKVAHQGLLVTGEKPYLLWGFRGVSVLGTLSGMAVLLYVILALVVGVAGYFGWKLWRQHLRVRAEDQLWRHADSIAAGLRTLDEVDAMTGAEFERLVAGLCRRDGCTDVRTVGGAGDNGADVLCRFPDGRTAVIQCKRYSTKSRIPPREMRDLLGSKAHFAADVAVFVTTTQFTKQSTEFAVTNGILAIHRDYFGLWSKGTKLDALAELNGLGQGVRRKPKGR